MADISQVHSKDKNITYTYDELGRLLKEEPHLMPQTMVDEPNSFASVLGKEGSEGLMNLKDLIPDPINSGKSAITDAIAQLPFLIPSGGKLRAFGKMAGSLGAGTFVDQLMNSDRSVTSSASDALLKTIIGGSIPWLREHEDILKNLKLPSKISTHVGTSSMEPSINSRQSIVQPLSQVSLTPEMQTNLDLIDRLTTRLSRSKTKSQTTQLNNALEAAQAALEAATPKGSIINSSGTTQRGNITNQGVTTTIGNSMVERLLGSLLNTKIMKTKELDKLSKFLTGYLPNLTADVTLNKRDNK